MESLAAHTPARRRIRPGRAPGRVAPTPVRLLHLRRHETPPPSGGRTIATSLQDRASDASRRRTSVVRLTRGDATLRVVSAILIPCLPPQRRYLLRRSLASHPIRTGMPNTSRPARRHDRPPRPGHVTSHEHRSARLHPSRNLQRPRLKLLHPSESHAQIYTRLLVTIFFIVAHPLYPLGYEDFEGLRSEAYDLRAGNFGTMGHDSTDRNIEIAVFGFQPKAREPPMKSPA